MLELNKQMGLLPLMETEQFPLAVSTLNKKYDIFDGDIFTDLCLFFNNIIVEDFETLMLFIRIR